MKWILNIVGKISGVVNIKLVGSVYLVKAGGGYMLEFWPRSTSRPKTGVFCVLITEARETSALEMPDKENTFVIKVNKVNAAALKILLFLRIMISFLDPLIQLSFYKLLNDFIIHSESFNSLLAMSNLPTLSNFQTLCTFILFCFLT